MKTHEIDPRTVDADFEGRPSGGAVVCLFFAVLFFLGVVLFVLFPEFEQLAREVLP